MKKAIIFLTILGLVISSPGLSLAAESADSSSSSSSAEAPLEAENPAAVQEANLPDQEVIPAQGQLFPGRDDGEGQYIDPQPTEPDGKTLNVEADTFSGAFTYGYPLVVPSGRNGLQPDLRLSYNNQNLSHDNLFGYGWQLNLPSIERVNKLGVDDLYNQLYFSSSLSGELETIELTDGIHGSYGAKTENESFLRYEFLNDNSWQVTDKSGTVYTFGLADNSRQSDPGDNSRIFKWLIAEIRDTNDNFISYEYYKSGGQVYPSVIRYTGHGNQAGIFSLEFLRENRPDSQSFYQAGFAVQDQQRISEVQAKLNGQWVIKYEFDYQAGDNGHKSILSSITKSARNEQGQVETLPADEFEYFAEEVEWVE
ncbi:MAG: hypothetical protein COU22_02975, partial [Candidatus Komeilibacteria bacterium CG10_big_fil_rev_8_21_14_0_10_41_13]